VQYVPAVQESILSYEGGAKAQFLDRRLSINGALFYMDYTNKQLRSKRIDPTFGIIDVIVNIPKSHIQGAEVEINALPARGLSLGLAATYIDSKIDQYSGVNAGGLVANFAGSAIPFTPSQQYGGNARYEYPVAQSISAFISAQLTYRSKTMPSSAGQRTTILTPTGCSMRSSASSLGVGGRRCFWAKILQQILLDQRRRRPRHH